MTLQDILRAKGGEVHTIGPDANLNDVVQALVRHNVGSLVVCEPAAEGKSPCMVGIITERDILRAHAANQGQLQAILVASVMSADPVTAAPGDQVQHAMGLMTRKRFRHLPILRDGRLQGMISIGDVVKAQFDELTMENHFMRSYIQGEGAEVATA